MPPNSFQSSWESDMASKKAPGTKTVTPKSMPKEGRNPKGGLTEEGRAYFAKRDGSNLKPGVTGEANTPEKMRRKGSFLVRTFTHPRGPMLDAKGQPTRLALSAHAWGEPIPKSISAAHKLAAKGHTLLSKYHAAQEKAAKATSKKAVKKPSSEKAAKKPSSEKAAKKVTKRST
jgi:hypothetical protein